MYFVYVTRMIHIGIIFMILLMQALYDDIPYVYVYAFVNILLIIKPYIFSNSKIM